MNRFDTIIKRIVISIFCILVSCPALVNAIEYIQRDIPSLGGDHVWVWDLNEYGQVVGFSSTLPDQNLHAFYGVWHGNKWVMTDLGTLGGISSQAVSINDSAQITGYSKLADGTEHAFIYTAPIDDDERITICHKGKKTLVISVDDLPGHLAHGDTIGPCPGDSGMVDLGTLGGDSSHGIDINDVGQVVGKSRIATGEIHAFLYDNGEMMDIGTLDGGTESWAYAISNLGEIIGFSDTAAAPGVFRAFMWRSNPEHHAGTIWQISTVENDFSDANLVLNVHSNTGLTEFTVPGNTLLPNTTYYWRAAFVDEYGAISDWPAQTFSFTTPDVLANNPPLQPSNLDPSTTVDTLTPTFSVGSYSDPDGDSHSQTEWQISTVANDFSSPILDDLSSTAVNTYVIPAGLLSFDMTYYWRVRFHDERGAASAWSSASFSTPSTSSNNPPIAPVLGSPASGSVNVGLTPTLDLDIYTQPFSDPDGDQHGTTQWQIGDTQDFTGNIVFDKNSAEDLDLLRVPPLVLSENTQYWWRARFYDHKGGASAWSTPSSFTTLTIPAANTPNTPPNTPTLSAVTATSLTPTLTTGAYVDAESNAHTGTRWQLSTDSAFTALLVDELSTTAKESYVVPAGLLSYNTTYYWRARFYDQYNGESAWPSTAGTFTTPATTVNGPPATPTLSAPSDDSLSPVLTASGYNDPEGDGHGQTQWQISTASDFSTLIMDLTSTTDLLSFTVPAGYLLPGTTYYWRAFFYDIYNNQSTAPSPISWTTLTAPANNPPNAPYLLSPENGSTTETLTPTLQTKLFFDSDGIMTDLGTLGTGLSSEGLLINDYSEISGDSTLDDSSDKHAFLWVSSVLTDLGTLGGNISLAAGINNRTQIVGGSEDATKTLRAFLWENGNISNLQDPLMLPIASTWDFAAATGINTAREITVTGTLDENRVSALLYPDPSTVPANVAPNPPVILSPTSTDTDVAVSPTLKTDPNSFDDPDGGKHLKTQFQISSLNDFSVIILDLNVTDLNNLYDLVVPDGILKTGQTYYWRVRFYDIDNDFSQWATESFSTINSPPNAPTIVAPVGDDAKDLDPAADLTLVTGPFFDPESNGHALTQWQVTTTADSGFASPIVDVTSSTDLTSYTITAASAVLHSGASYMCRARFYDDLNGVSEWSSTSSFYMVGSAPDAPALLSPADGATEIALDATLQSGTFVDPDGNGHYSTQWQISTTSNFTDFVLDDLSTTNLTSYSLTGLVATGKTYYWHVRYTDTTNERTSWSETRSFVTVNTPPDQPVLQLPVVTDPAPTLTSSAFNDPDGNTHSASRWVISTSADFSNAIIDDKSTTQLTTYAVPIGTLSSGTTYYLEVQYFDEYDLPSALSTAISYTTTNTPPNPPVPSLPNGTTETLPLTLQTDGTYSDTENHAHYQTEWQIDINADFNSSDLVTISPAPNTDLTSTIVSSVPRGVDFYWRARYYDIWGDPSAWSTALSFSILNNGPAAPVLSSPANGQTDVPRVPTLTTNGAYTDPDSDPHAQTQWQLSSASDFSSLLVDETSSTALHSLTPTVTLDSNTTYSWRARFYDSYGGISDWSATSQFTTSTNSPPDQPILSAPADGATGQSLVPALQTDGNFNDSDGDTHSETQWQICHNSDFTTDIVLDVTHPTQLYQLTVPDLALAENDTYYWRVKYFDSSGGGSIWSLVRTFSTGTRSSADSDNNGLPDAQELDTATQSSVDLDLDGTSDLAQADISDLNTYDNATQVGIKVRSGVTVASMESINPASIADTTNRPSADQFAFGMVQFKLNVPSPGDTAQVTVYYGSPAASNAQWWKWDPIDGWQNYSANAVFSADRTFVTIDLQDGGIGDADGIANGVIIDPSGLREPPKISPSGNKRGCFIATATSSDSAGYNPWNLLVIGFTALLIAIERFFKRESWFHKEI